ncbi:MAG: cytochrome [Marmoricola sp.]|nr:cytochrome [Marmoricola sp.]MCW2837053.1 cytochrome [Marmoricola sp.]
MSTVTLPEGPTTPRLLQSAQLLLDRNRTMRRLRGRYGSAFMVQMPVFGRTLVLSDPREVKQLFQTSPELADTIDANLGSVLGPGSMFALEGQEHRRQRKLLTPPFHGRRLKVYEELIEREAVLEMATWPEVREFPTMDSMMRITLNAILRTVFGADGAELDELRRLLPGMVTLGSRLAVVPVPRNLPGRYAPWKRFEAQRARYDAIVDRLIDQALRDPDLDGRQDVLSMMLQATYDDGTAMSRSDVADQLLTMLSAGHETTATTLAWTVERLRRHPDVLRRLVEEVDAGGSELRQAALIEVQRVRPVIDLTARQVRAESLTLGRWSLPRGQTVLVSIALMHADEELFENAATFDPDRFVGARPDTYGWIPFGGGVRRCIGAAFATMELDVVLRTLLRDFTLLPTDQPDESWHSRGIAIAPGRKGLAVVRRRATGDSPASTAPAVVSA